MEELHSCAAVQVGMQLCICAAVQLGVEVGVQVVWKVLLRVLCAGGGDSSHPVRGGGFSRGAHLCLARETHREATLPAAHSTPMAGAAAAVVVVVAAAYYSDSRRSSAALVRGVQLRLSDSSLTLER